MISAFSIKAIAILGRTVRNVAGATRPSPDIREELLRRKLVLLKADGLQPYWLRRVPMPSITISTTVPGFMGSTPSDVPQAMTSPGTRVMS